MRRIGGRIERRYSGHTDWVRALAVNPVRGAVFATGSDDETVRVWRVGRDAAIASLTDATSAVYSVEWSGDGQRLASGGLDGRVRVYEEAGGHCRPTSSLIVGMVVCMEWRWMVRGIAWRVGSMARGGRAWWWEWVRNARSRDWLLRTEGPGWE